MHLERVYTCSLACTHAHAVEKRVQLACLMSVQMKTALLHFSAFSASIHLVVMEDKHTFSVILKIYFKTNID